MIYTKEAIEYYALHHAVKIVDTDGDSYEGWLVYNNKEYLLLPLNDIWTTYTFKRSHIKEICHLTNGQLIPKVFKYGGK